MLLVRICAGGGEQSLSLPRRKSVGSRAGVFGSQARNEERNDA
jgi:predicted nucleotidyltransferase